MQKTTRSTLRLAARALLTLSLAAPALAQASFGGFRPPEGWIPPALHPGDVQLQTKELGPGVYALLSNRPPVDNSGFVVGERGVLVIDAHINGVMAAQILAAVRSVTDKPILYLVNTNSHGDHTFGNYAFPRETLVVAHRATAKAMERFEEEKALLLPTVNGDSSVFEGVELRLPDITFESSLRLDLGGRVVELHHFGQGNTAGDTVVYEPQSKVAWTGNLILGVATIPWAIDGGVQTYLETVARFARALDIETIVPGHVLVTDGDAARQYLSYLSWLIESVRSALRDGASLEATLARLPLDESYLASPDSALAPIRPFMQGFHLWNVKKAYLELSGAAPTLD